MTATGPTRAQLEAARDGSVPDLLAPHLRLLLVGINPSLWSAWSGHHFGRPTNRLWRTLHESGLTPRRLRPGETAALLDAGIGVTNLVARATARADELSPDEIRAGLPRLEQVSERWAPGVVAVLGVTAYRTAFRDPRAGRGRQDRTVGGRPVWLLPNPSGLNAHDDQPALTRQFAELRAALDAGLGDG